MTDVLGYDIYGRKLRAGDQVMLTVVKDPTWVEGWGPFTCSRVHLKRADVVVFKEIGHGGKRLGTLFSAVRKLTDDDRVATDAFREWFVNRMDQIHSDSCPAREREIGAAMSWTEGVAALDRAAADRDEQGGADQ